MKSLTSSDVIRKTSSGPAARQVRAYRRFSKPSSSGFRHLKET